MTAAGGAYAHCRRLVAETDKERHWATFYAPAGRRDALYALYAFDHEVARVPAIVREPMAGEIRLQWWREALEGMRDEEAAANPVAAALLDAVQCYDLPVGQLIALIDAYGTELYREAAVDFDSYAAATHGTIITLAARILGGEGETVEHIARHAGLAQAHAAAGHAPEARAHLASARGLLEQVPAEILPALLPVAVVGPSLGRALPLWRRQWLIWRAARDRRRIFS